MDTNSENNKSWDKLVSRARTAQPPGDDELLARVQRAIAAEAMSTSRHQTSRSLNWLDEIAALSAYRWAPVAFGALVIFTSLLGWQSLAAWSDMAFALDLHLPTLTDFL